MPWSKELKKYLFVILRSVEDMLHKELWRDRVCDWSTIDFSQLTPEHWEVTASGFVKLVWTCKSRTSIWIYILQSYIWENFSSMKKCLLELFQGNILSKVENLWNGMILMLKNMLSPFDWTENLSTLGKQTCFFLKILNFYS